MSAIQSTQPNVFVEMAAQIAKFAKETSKRDELDEELNKICAKHDHPFGVTLKTERVEVGFQPGYGPVYDNKEYQACRFCGVSVTLNL